MLCQFTVKNYKSIRDEVTFDMQAAAISEHEDRIIKDYDGELFLPVSAIYGPNGGGKSNVLEAIYSLAFKVLRPLYAAGENNDRIFLQKRSFIEPFVFSKETKNKPTEFEILYCLMQHFNNPVTLATLLDEVWGYDSGEDVRMLRVHVGGLRNKIEANPKVPAYLHTVTNVGYKLTPFAEG